MPKLDDLPAEGLFLILLAPLPLMYFHWGFSALGWVLTLGWYVLIRASLTTSTRYLRHPLYIVAAVVSFMYAPVLVVLTVLLGEAPLNKLARDNSYLFLPPLGAAVFVVYSAWTAARAIVIAEEKTPADRAVRWERTLKPFLQLLFWPVGLWFVHKRYERVAG